MDAINPIVNLLLEFDSTTPTDTVDCDPTGIVATDNTIIIADNINHKLKAFDKCNGALIEEFEEIGGMKLKNPEQLVQHLDSLVLTSYGLDKIFHMDVNCRKIHHVISMPKFCDGICLDSSGSCIVSIATGKPRILFINEDGIQKTIQLTAKNLPLFQLPYYIHSHGDILYITDSGEHKLVAITTETEPKILFEYTGDSKKKTSEPSREDHKLNEPRGVLVDPQGRILVCDHGNNRIQVLNTRGEFLMMLLSEKDGLEKPWAISYRAGELFVTQRGGKVKVFKYHI
ncbi:unnamed protein product [Owenia fusiformis]|uniref:Uncharacterized protein n=1 Tax=Owenia fusiformis TaxID=6347 RepID=A0A8J1UVX5_OWEFU|nr:unnamed protein product [Owenia fusiformis]